MNTTIEQIRVALNLYLSDTAGLVDIPAGLLSLLEDADENSRGIAESIEGVLALYAVNRIAKDTLKDRLRELLDETALVHLAPAQSQNVVFFWEQYAPLAAPLGAVLIGVSGNSYLSARPVGESNAFSQTPFVPRPAEAIAEER
jgi:hypothetical protein